VNKAARNGFSLIEILVAIAIFSVLAAMAYSGLNTIVRTREVISDQAQRLKNVQQVVGRLERTLDELLPRPIRGSYGETLPALIGNSKSFEATHAAFASIQSELSSKLARSSYQVIDGKLMLSNWDVLDRTASSQAQNSQLLERVIDFNVRYQDSAGQWQDRWPPQNGQNVGDDRLPRLIEFRLRLQDLGTLTRRITPVNAVENAR
jgi:general secretion pathway protein J